LDVVCSSKNLSRPIANDIQTTHQSWLTDTALAEIANITLSNAQDFELHRPKADNLVQLSHVAA
jgi:lactate dehydrogenase-like 2-hydroxyacid dehydrogenase